MGFRVLTAEISHETNTFSILQTDEDDFRNRFFLRGEKALSERAAANTELAGFLDVARQHDWAVEHVLSIAAGPSGYVKRNAFNWFCDPVVGRASDGQFDGILLALHGAMVPDFCEDGEGELLRRIRKVIDRTVPIAITIDPHANVTKQMCELADIIVAFKTYPHVDMRETARLAAQILHRAMKSEIKPRTIMARPPMLEESNGGRTDVGPMIDRLEKARKYEELDDVFAVSVNAGFASADIEEVGPSVLVTAQGDFDSHMSFAEDLSDDIWACRNHVLNKYYTVDEAAQIALSHRRSDGPLVIADYADNPGAGSYGDSTSLLKSLLDAEICDACFGPMVDGETVQLLMANRIGARLALTLGGKTDPRFGGGPLMVDAELVAKSDGHYEGRGTMMAGLNGSFGPSAVIKIDGIEVLVTTLASQMLDLEQFRAFGIDPALKRTVAIKSMQHFRADFEPIAGKVIVCDSGALCTLEYHRMNYQNARRPIHPIDDIEDKESAYSFT